MRGNSTKWPPLPYCRPAEFSIWTREAGAGGLSIAVEGPSKAEIAFEDRKDGSCGVSYVVQEPGRCSHSGWGQSLYLLTNGLCYSPLHQSLLPLHPKFLHPLRTEPWNEAGLGEICPFCPSPGKCTDQPPSSGDYEVSIKFNDEHIPDSPFVVPVASLSDDARRLTVTSLQVCARGGTRETGRSLGGQAHVASD